MTILFVLASLAAVAVGALFLADSKRTEAGPRPWVYWPSSPRFGRRALIPGLVIVAGGLASLVITLLRG